MGRMLRGAFDKLVNQGVLKKVEPGSPQDIAMSNPSGFGQLLKGYGIMPSTVASGLLGGTEQINPLVQQPLPPLQFDNPERAGRIEASLGRAAFGPERIREILMQLKEANFLANGGRVGFQEGGRIAFRTKEGGPIPFTTMVMPGIFPPTLNRDSQGRMVDSITGVPLNMDRLFNSITGVPLSGETTPTSLPLSGETTPTSLQFDNPERAERIEASLIRAAFEPERIREILMQLKAINYLADGGIVSLLLRKR